jgi:hypothetical protein
MNLYHFSPIQSKEKLLEAVSYVATQTSLLSQKVLGHVFPMSSLTIFSHYLDEYEKLEKFLQELGDPFNKNNGPRVLLHKPITVEEHMITHLRIRHPDPYRMQVGCNDFDVPIYTDFKNTYLASHPDHLRLIERKEYEMIEYFHPDFDVLAYVVSKPK